MQIAFHIGANCTDEDRLIKSILKNTETLLRQGIAVPGPGRYRSLIREATHALDGKELNEEARDILIDAICESDNVDRIVMSNDNFICIPNRIFDNSIFYPQADTKVRGLHRLFPGDDIELFMGIRHPAAFLEETLKRANAPSLTAYLGMLRPEDLSWADVVHAIKKAAPDTPLTIWCNEDAPLMWERLIRSITDVNSEDEIAGGLDMVAHLISGLGINALRTQLAEANPQTHAERENIIADFWEENEAEDDMEDEISLTRLTASQVDILTENYENDIEDIAQMDGVTLLMPCS